MNNIGFRTDKDILYISLEGRIDATNAAETEAKIAEIRKVNPGTHTVLDADALSIVSENMELLEYIRGRGVITPHPGEMSRLLNKSISEVEKDRIENCRKFALEYELVVLLKGFNTVISDGKEVIINTTGNSKMASGGMGDCLTGIIASLIAQNKDLYIGTVLGCYIHGLAGDKLSKNRYCINARDIIEEVPKIMEYI